MKLKKIIRVIKSRFPFLFSLFINPAHFTVTYIGKGHSNDKLEMDSYELTYSYL